MNKIDLLCSDDFKYDINKLYKLILDVLSNINDSIYCNHFIYSIINTVSIKYYNYTNGVIIFFLITSCDNKYSISIFQNINKFTITLNRIYGIKYYNISDYINLQNYIYFLDRNYKFSIDYKDNIIIKPNLNLINMLYLFNIKNN